jgi:16S rRNA (guanine527-N7)-methyltransferase
MDKSIFIEEVRKIYPNRDINFDLFEKYKEYIQKENEFYNLSNIVSDEKIYFEYFFNSILPYSDFNFNNKELLDIGSGSGIPGIALKIIFPEMKLTIIESNLKKIKFMENLKDILLLDDVTFLNIRAEEIS